MLVGSTRPTVGSTRPSTEATPMTPNQRQRASRTQRALDGSGSHALASAANPRNPHRAQRREKHLTNQHSEDLPLPRGAEARTASLRGFAELSGRGRSFSRIVYTDGAGARTRHPRMYSTYSYNYLFHYVADMT